MFNIDKDLGFVILYPEFRFSALRATVSTIKTSFNNPSCICVVPDKSNEEDIKNASSICPVARGKNSISSMINTGIRQSERPWNLVIVAGNIIGFNSVFKYLKFVKSKTDVMYRVTDKARWRWEDSSIHGLLMHKDALKEVGAFPEDEESLQTCKLFWGYEAIRKGYVFKGLVGVKLI